MSAETLDFMTRKSVARWCHTVAIEDVGTTDHAARVAIAKTMAENIAPSTADRDTALTNVVFLVRAFVQGDEGTATDADIDTLVASIFTDCVMLGAFR